MTLNQHQQDRQNEQGNVLFLILIAVALFAALSYAVTQSSRSGGGDAAGETALVNSAQLTQYPAGVRTSMVRMIIGGQPAESLAFDAPASFAAFCTATPGRCVFHPSGGGATFQQAPSDVMASGAPGNWTFNGHFEIENIGTSVGTNAAGNEIIAFLPGVTSGLCARINTELGISGDTDTSSDLSANYNQYMSNTYTLPASETILGTATGAAGLTGQPFGCFRNNGGAYVYYHVLIER